MTLDLPERNGKPSSVRYLVLGAATLTAVLLYLDRICISFAERFIREDLGLSDRQMGWVLSAFFWSYAIGQVPSGWLGDRFGARIMLTSYVLGWSLFTAATGLAGGLASLLALRLGFGLAQAGAYPTCALLLSRWMPFSTRGWASGIVAFGGRVGGTIAPILTASLIVLLVPVSHDSRLTEEDLLDVRQLCHLIVSPVRMPAQKLSERFRERASRELSIVVETCALQYRKRTKEQVSPARSTSDATHGVPQAPNAEERASVLEQLNLLLAEADLFAEPDFADVPLNREARRLLATPRHQLSNASLLRLNRLLIEATCPGAIRQLYVAGWRKTMIAFGVAGTVIALMCWSIIRDRPTQHARCNVAELRLIEGTRATPGDQTAMGLPIQRILRSRSLWLSCLSQFGTNLGWVFLITWLPRYLLERHQVPVLTRGVMASTPLFVGWLGMLAGGYLTDWLTRRVGQRWGRGLPMSLTRFLAAAAYLGCLLPLGPWSVTLCLALVAFATDLGVASVWAFKQDVGGRFVGSILGWGNMWGNLGAAVSPILLEWMLSRHGDWNAAFLTCAIAFLVSGIAGLGVDATIPIENHVRTTHRSQHVSG